MSIELLVNLANVLTGSEIVPMESQAMYIGDREGSYCNPIASEPETGV